MSFRPRLEDAGDLRIRGLPGVASSIWRLPMAATMPTESPRRKFLAESKSGLLHIVECCVGPLLSSLRGCSLHPLFESDTVKPDPAFLFKLFCGEGQSLFVWKSASLSWTLFFTSTTVSQLGANIASCEVNTTTFESTDRPVSTCSLVWEDRPLSNFSHGTGSPTYQPAPLHGSERWFKSKSPFFLATSKSATVPCLRCGVALSPHLSLPVAVIVHFRTMLHFAASKRCHSSDTDPAMHVRKNGSVGLHCT